MQELGNALGKKSCEEAENGCNAAWFISLSSFVVSIFFVSAVWVFWFVDKEGDALGERNYASPIGWCAAAAAAVAFGFVEVPIKITEGIKAGPLVFNALGFIASGLAHGLFLLRLHSSNETFHWRWEGSVAAMDLMLVQICAREAILLLGIAVAPPLWCAIGMITSFAWGTLAFGDHPNDMPMSLVGLGLIVGGIGLVSRASSLEFEDDSDADERQPILQSLPTTSRTPNTLMKGLAFTLCAGMGDGSLVAFYQHLEAHSHTTSAIFCYFGSFAITILVIGLLILISFYAAHPDARLEVTQASASQNMRRMVPGMISGVMWAGGNSCSVLASHFLGMALSFPLTQTACVFSALVGMFVFGEISSVAARVVFGVGLAIVLVGAFLLSIFGRADASLAHIVTATHFLV